MSSNLSEQFKVSLVFKDRVVIKRIHVINETKAQVTYLNKYSEEVKVQRNSHHYKIARSLAKAKVIAKAELQVRVVNLTENLAVLEKCLDAIEELTEEGVEAL